NFFCTVSIKPLQKELRLLLSHASCSDLSRAVVESDLHILITFHSSSKVDLQRGAASDLFQYVVVDDMLGAGTIEIHQVEIADAMIFKLPGYVEGIVAVGLLCGVITFRETDTLAVYDVYGGDNSHLDLIE